MKKALFLISLLFLLNRCGKEDPVPDVPENPTIANLVFPYENSLCNEGTNITASESTVLFEWEAGEYADKYVLNLKNLTTGVITTHQTSDTEIPVILFRGTPYSWYVVSKSNSVAATATSAIWKFYNAGEGVRSYAPFPAEILIPSMASTVNSVSGMITLDWNGSDVDGDIEGYDVCFGTTTTPGIIYSNVNESILNNVPVSSNTIYYWEIITKDSHGNKSYSGVYQFKVL
jgi:hypothetical protein